MIKTYIIMDFVFSNGQICGGAAALRFQYSDGSMGLFNSWNAMVEFWTPYYASRADADRHLRRIAYGCLVAKDGTPVRRYSHNGPLNAQEKSQFINV